MGRVEYISYGAHQIPFELRTKKKYSRSITIKINTNCQVIVSAPARAKTQDIMHMLHQRSEWIFSKLQALKDKKQQIIPLEYVSGESHFYLGEKYRLNFIQKSMGAACVTVQDECLQVTSKFSNPQAKKILYNFYKKQAQEIFQQRLESLFLKTPWVKTLPPLRLRFMKSRWGSCSSAGNITLNIHLIKASIECIDSVILHELCHIAEHNHGPRFYALLTHVSPDWKALKNELNKNTSVYLNA